MANRTTKNINVSEKWYGFAVYNNYEIVATYDNIAMATEKAFAIALEENKGVRIETDYVHEKYSFERVSALSKDYQVIVAGTVIGTYKNEIDAKNRLNEARNSFLAMVHPRDAFYIKAV